MSGPPMIPETEAATRIAEAISSHLACGKYVQPAVVEEFAQKAVAHRDFIRSVYDDLDADPDRLGQRDKRLQQDQIASQSTEDFWIEHAHYHLGGYREAVAHLRKMGSPHVPEFDPDAREGDREDDRRREERTDEKAREQAPRVAS